MDLRSQFSSVTVLSLLLQFHSVLSKNFSSEWFFLRQCDFGLSSGCFQIFDVIYAHSWTKSLTQMLSVTYRKKVLWIWISCFFNWKRPHILSANIDTPCGKFFSFLFVGVFTLVRKAGFWNHFGVCYFFKGYNNLSNFSTIFFLWHLIWNHASPVCNKHQQVLTNIKKCLPGISLPL